MTTDRRVQHRDGQQRRVEVARPIDQFVVTLDH